MSSPPSHRCRGRAWTITLRSSPGGSDLSAPNRAEHRLLARGRTTRGGKRSLPTARRAVDSWARSSTTTVLASEDVEKVLTTQRTRTFADARGSRAGRSRRGAPTPVAVAPPGTVVLATPALARDGRGCRGGSPTGAALLPPAAQARRNRPRRSTRRHTACSEP